MRYWIISLLCMTVAWSGLSAENSLTLLTPELMPEEEEEGAIEPYPKKAVGKASKDGVHEASHVSQYVLPIVVGAFFVGAVIVVSHHQGHHHHHHAHNY